MLPAFTRLGHIIPSPSGSSVGGSELSRHRDQRRCCALVHVEVVVDEPKQQQPPPFAAVITFTMWVHCCMLQEGSSSKIVAHRFWAAVTIHPPKKRFNLDFFCQVIYHKYNCNQFRIRLLAVGWLNNVEIHHFLSNYPMIPTYQWTRNQLTNLPNVNHQWF